MSRGGRRACLEKSAPHSPRKEQSQKQQHWGEVLCRDDRPHIFHPTHTARFHDKATPASTSQASFHAGKALVHYVGEEVISKTRADRSSYLRRPLSLSGTARSTLRSSGTQQGQMTPRTFAFQQQRSGSSTHNGPLHSWEGGGVSDGLNHSQRWDTTSRLPVASDDPTGLLLHLELLLMLLRLW
eukprot:CAMPEP_0172861480 /NCGR_PEP_ID=MMETSP1075-20121228/72685_1 /TAXON_ID=2916 /ORGANISM="Ceratium fusus, Strain PA161109" /LENGTH=183 /DNA_ID=CAMNT_0013709619 /DNA_START=27 /DNA_END=576 /DNA_ORIENTATION=-